LKPAWGPEVSARKKVSAIMVVLVMLLSDAARDRVRAA